MKKILTFLIVGITIFTIVLISCQQQPESVKKTTTTVTDTVSLMERYVEEYEKSDSRVIQYWTYNSDNSLDGFGVCTYDVNGNNTKVDIYSNETTDVSFKKEYYEYTYTFYAGAVTGSDNGYRATAGNAYSIDNGTPTLTRSFTATYNTAGQYTDYIYKENNITKEHRTCAYDGNGNYFEEIYYDGDVTADSNILFKYNSYYENSDDFTQYTTEILEKYVYDQTGDVAFSIKLYYQFHWDLMGQMIQQTTFDESFDITKVILYDKDSYYGTTLKKTYLENFQMQRQIDYSYSVDSSGDQYLAEKKDYDYVKGGRLDNYTNYRYYDKNGKYYYEESLYKCYYASDMSKSVYSNRFLNVYTGIKNGAKNSFYYLRPNRNNEN